MGIQGLLGMLKEIQTPTHVREYKGKTLAVDAYVWLHRGAYGCAQELATGAATLKYVNYAMHRVRMLKHYGVTPLIVFDGGYLPSKAGTEDEREHRRSEALAKGNALLAEGKLALAREAFVKAVNVTPAMAYQLIKALRREGIEYIVAPYEADPQLAYLEREGIVDGVITEDSDLLIFGCRTVLFKLDGEGACVAIERAKFSQCREYNFAGWTDDDFRHMAILSGCDYLNSVVGLGLKTAYKLLKKYKTPEKVIQFVRLEGNLTVPRDYLDQFKRAEMTFLHQRVFCPSAKSLVHFTPLPDHIVDAATELPFVGAPLEEEVARLLAEGEIDPITKEPIVDLNPGQIFGSGSNETKGSTGNSGRLPLKGNVGKVQKTTPTVKGSILNFFKKAPTPATGDSRASAATTSTAIVEKIKMPSFVTRRITTTSSSTTNDQVFGTSVSRFFGGAGKVDEPTKETGLNGDEPTKETGLNGDEEHEEEMELINEAETEEKARQKELANDDDDDDNDEEAEAAMRECESLSLRNVVPIPIAPPSTVDYLSSPPSAQPFISAEMVEDREVPSVPLDSDVGWVSSPVEPIEVEIAKVEERGPERERTYTPENDLIDLPDLPDLPELPDELDLPELPDLPDLGYTTDEEGVENVSSPVTSPDRPAPKKPQRPGQEEMKVKEEKVTITSCPIAMGTMIDLSSDPIGPSSDFEVAITPRINHKSGIKAVHENVRPTMPARAVSKKRSSQEVDVGEDENEQQQKSVASAIGATWRSKFMLSTSVGNGSSNKRMKMSSPVATSFVTPKPLGRCRTTSTPKTISAKDSVPKQVKRSSSSTLTPNSIRAPLSPRKSIIPSKKGLASSTTPVVPRILSSTPVAAIDFHHKSSSPIMITNPNLLKWRFQGAVASGQSHIR